jgi:hypothetical protein
MNMNELMSYILEKMPYAEFSEDPDSGEILISTGLVGVGVVNGVEQLDTLP